MDDLEKLLNDGVQPTGDQGSQSTAPVEKKPNAANGDEDLDKKISSIVAKATESIRTELSEERKLRKAATDELARVGQVIKPIEQIGKPAEPALPDLNTTEGWKGFIGQQSSEAVKPALSEIQKLKDAQKSKALKAFVKDHPEYAIANGKEKLTELLSHYERVKSRSDLDADDISEDLKDAWALQNRNTLEQQARAAHESQIEADTTAADLASSGAGGSVRTSSASADATPLQRKVAAELNMTIDDYLAYQSKLR